MPLSLSRPTVKLRKMNFCKKAIYLLLITFFFLALPKNGSSQPSPVDCDDPATDPALCPIDGGLAILVATGAGLGLLRKKRKI